MKIGSFPASNRAGFCVMVALALLPSFGPAAQPPAQDSDPELVRAIDAALDAPALQTGFQGVIVQDLNGGVLYARNPDHVFLPASNNKLLTSCAALSLLGPDYRYHTRLWMEGKLGKDGTFRGDLVLQGAGDPLLTLEDLESLAKQAVQAGLKRVRGGVTYDDSRFDRLWIGDGWSWDDLSDAYAAEISALNVNHNVVRVKALPGARAGDPIRYTLTPAWNEIAVVNTAVTSASGGNPTVVIDRELGKNRFLIRGELPIGTSEAKGPAAQVTVEDPARFTAALFRDALARAGVRGLARAAPESRTVSDQAVLLTEHLSPALSDILKRMNKPSDNLLAECLLKTIGAAKTGKGTAETGSHAARDWLASIGLDLSRLKQVDGSGLSRFNYVSPHNFARLLARMHTEPTFSVLYDSLPIAGVDGTLIAFGRGTPAANNCRAKDGYIGNVSSLTGYVQDRDGETLVFSILMNNHLTSNVACRQAQADIVALLAEYTRKKALP